MYPRHHLYFSTPAINFGTTAVNFSNTILLPSTTFKNFSTPLLLSATQSVIPAPPLLFSSLIPAPPLLLSAQRYQFQHYRTNLSITLLSATPL
jgi:hypothetical protein